MFTETLISSHLGRCIPKGESRKDLFWNTVMHLLRVGWVLS